MTVKLDFEALFESSPNPYMVLDRELRYVAANAAYLAVTQRSRDELIGRRIADVFPHDPNDPMAEAKGVRLEVGPMPNAIVRADTRRLQQVVWNLLTNAVKFTPVGGRVRLDVLREDDAIEIVVADDGSGIDAEFLPHVFERFQQALGSTRAGGLGLGLSIVKHVVERHDGTVSAESAGKGKGATFRVRLPLPSAHALAAASTSSA